MKRPNGSGGVRKLSGKRRHPYQAVVSIHEGGRRKQVSLGCYRTKKEALEALGKQSTSNLDIRKRKVTFGDICEIIIPKQKASVQVACRGILPKFDPIKDMPIADIRTSDLNLVTEPLGGLSHGTHKKVRMLAAKVYEYAIQDDIVLKDYSQYMTFPAAKPIKKKRPLTPSEIAQLGDDPLWQVMLYSGMRVSEALLMEDQDIYEEDGILCFHVRKSKTEAGIRTFPVHSAIMKYTRPYAVKSRTFAVAQNDFRRLGIPHTTHSLRHTFISGLKLGGADEYYIQEIVGHSHKTLTEQVYMHSTIKELKKTIEMLRLDF